MSRLRYSDIGLPPVDPDVELHSPPEEMVTAVERPLQQDEIAAFLKHISQLESSGGKNTNHKVMKHGIHAGTSAVGQYGLMPLTIKDLAKAHKKPEINRLARMPASEIQQIVKTNPDVEYQIAEHLARKVLRKQAGDQDKAAFSWNQGHNLSPEEIERRKYLEHDYVKKFQKLKQKLGG